MRQDLLPQSLQSFGSHNRLFAVRIQCCGGDTQIVGTYQFLEIETDCRSVPIEVLVVNGLIEQALTQLRSCVYANLHLFGELVENRRIGSFVHCFSLLLPDILDFVVVFE